MITKIKNAAGAFITGLFFAGIINEALAFEQTGVFSIGLHSIVELTIAVLLTVFVIISK